MPFLIANWRLVLEVVVIGALALALTFQTTAKRHYKAKAEAVQAEFDGFKLKVAALGEAAKADAKRKETENADRIKTAVSERDRAIKRLSDERAGRSVVPFTPPDPGGGGKVCYDRAAFESALQRFAERTAELIDEGDRALIDSKALLDAWPR
jgi:hypothetical protein